MLTTHKKQYKENYVNCVFFASIICIPCVLGMGPIYVFWNLWQDTPCLLHDMNANV